MVTALCTLLKKRNEEAEKAMHFCRQWNIDFMIEKQAWRKESTGGYREGKGCVGKSLV